MRTRRTMWSGTLAAAGLMAAALGAGCLDEDTPAGEVEQSGDTPGAPGLSGDGGGDSETGGEPGGGGDQGGAATTGGAGGDDDTRYQDPDPEVTPEPDPDPEVTPEPDPDPEVTPEPDRDPDPEPECLAPNGSCWSAGECCDGLFCTYAGTDYVPGECSHPQANGAWCLDDGWCQGGHCVDSACQAQACAAAEAECWSHAECCPGTFCSYAGAYIAGSCHPPQPDGTPCQEDTWCQSGHCVDGVCAQPNCAVQGVECWSGAECCTGVCSWSTQNVYVPGTCIAPQPDGAACEDPAWCQSGQCSDGVCGPQACGSQGSECWLSGDCCDPTHVFCTNTWQDYNPGACQPRQPNGAWCFADDWCKSGHCVDSTCAAAGCQPTGEPCWSGGECCTGQCTWDGDNTVTGTCGGPQPDGTACVADAWCISGHCADGTCASPEAITFTELWALVLEPRGCTSPYCHGSFASPLPMPDIDTAYANLVGAQAAQPGCDLTIRVVPGDPDSSMMWHRVAPADLGAAWCGPKMPYGSDGLDLPDALLVKEWILQGAEP